jgi:hypothetical protein
VNLQISELYVGGRYIGLVPEKRRRRGLEEQEGVMTAATRSTSAADKQVSEPFLIQVSALVYLYMHVFKIIQVCEVITATMTFKLSILSLF